MLSKSEVKELLALASAEMVDSDTQTNGTPDIQEDDGEGVDIAVSPTGELEVVYL